MSFWLLAQDFSPPDQPPIEQFISKLQPHDLVAVLVLTLGAVIALVAIVATQWRMHKRTEVEAALKQEMLARGMSAEDIERVIKAGATSSQCEK